MARSFVLSAAVAAAVFTASDAFVVSNGYLKFSQGTAATSSTLTRCQGSPAETIPTTVTGAVTRGYYCVHTDKNIYKWTTATSATPYKLDKAVTVTGTALSATAITASTNLLVSGATLNDISHISVNTDGTFFAYMKITKTKSGGVVASVSYGGTTVVPTTANNLPVIGCQDYTVDVTVVNAGGAAPTTTALTGAAVTGKVAASAADCGSTAGNGLTLPQTPVSFACNGVAATPKCLIGNGATDAYILYQVDVTTMTSGTTGSTLSYGAISVVGSTSVFPTASVARVFKYGGAVKFASGAVTTTTGGTASTTGKFITVDGGVMRYVDIAALTAVDSSKLAMYNGAACDTVLGGGAACSSTFPAVVAAGASAAVVYSGLALSQVKNVNIVAFWTSADAKEIIYVDNSLVAVSGTAGKNAVVRCTFTTFATDTGSKCAQISAQSGATAGKTGLITYAQAFATTAVAMTDIIETVQTTSAGTARGHLQVFGFGNAEAKDAIQVLAINTMSRTVSVQTPVPNCKRNGRRFCTKTVTMRRTTTGGGNTTTTNGSTTNGSTTTTTTTTGGSASAPLVASVWAMVGVVAALIAA
jgi:hypothetical protein